MLGMNLNGEPKKWLKWLCYALWLGVILGLLFVVLLFFNIANSDLPSFEDLENPQYDLATIVYDVNGESFGKYYVENREQIIFEELSPKVFDALLATEDERFYQHSGIDFRALVRVAFKTVLLGQEGSGGGSTITQQLSKLLFVRPNLSGMSKMGRLKELIKVKLKEWVTAIKLEKSYTKEEIITMYLNKFEFINGAHGVQAASQTYFNKDQSQLETQEAAVLVGMLKNPSLYNPIRFPEKSINRRNIVLSQMHKHNKIDDEGLDSMRNKVLDMSNFERAFHDIGPAPHFRAELTKWLRSKLNNGKILKPDGSNYNIYTDGLKIFTTIDLNYQVKAEESMMEHLKWLQEKYWKVWKGMNPWTFEANPEQESIRSESLNRRLKESERYLRLHEEYLGEIKAEIMARHDNVRLSENVIKGLMLKEKGVVSWDSLVRGRYIKKEFIDTYKSVQSDDDWGSLKTKYKDLQEEFKRIFKEEISMKVFDYNEFGEKDVTMSPRDSVKYHNQHLQGGLLAVNPSNGHIKAWVGGSGFKYFKYDHVNSRRQVGSTIKPFVYTTAIAMQGMSPCQEFEDIQYTIAPGDGNLHVDKEWSPANANEEFSGNMYNLYQGLLYSKNSISVRLIKELGNVEPVRDLLNNVGISKELRIGGNGPLVVPRVPSICLGAIDLSLYEMTGAYTAFANNGVYTQPIFVTHIQDKNGKTIYSGVPERKTAINPLYNSVVLDMLQNNVGGGYGLKIKSKAGGKTGWARLCNGKTCSPIFSAET